MMKQDHGGKLNLEENSLSRKFKSLIEATAVKTESKVPVFSLEKICYEQLMMLQKVTGLLLRVKLLEASLRFKLLLRNIFTSVVSKFGQEVIGKVARKLMSLPAKVVKRCHSKMIKSQ
jgi:hypothetical protein